MSGDKRSNSPTGNPPSTGRTPTPSELAHEIRKMREMVAERLDRVEEFTDGEILKFIRESGAKYDTVSEKLAKLGARFDAATETVSGWRSDIRREMVEFDSRLLVVEERGVEHSVRLSTHDETLDDQYVRIRSLEQHRDGDARELALTRRQKTGMAALGTAGGGIAWLLYHLLGG